MSSQHPPPLVTQQTFCALLCQKVGCLLFFNWTVEMQLVKMGTRLSVVLLPHTHTANSVDSCAWTMCFSNVWRKQSSCCQGAILMTHKCTKCRTLNSRLLDANLSCQLNSAAEAWVQRHPQRFHISASILTRVLMNMRTEGSSLTTGLKLFSCQEGKLCVLSRRCAARSGDECGAAGCY